MTSARPSPHCGMLADRSTGVYGSGHDVGLREKMEDGEVAAPESTDLPPTEVIHVHDAHDLPLLVPSTARRHSRAIVVARRAAEPYT